MMKATRAVEENMCCQTRGTGEDRAVNNLNMNGKLEVWNGESRVYLVLCSLSAARLPKAVPMFGFQYFNVHDKSFFVRGKTVAQRK